MDQIKISKIVKWLVVITFLGMITVNALANILPLNGINTGQVSDSYPNLFAPAGITFSIWGLIYLLLALYTIYQLGIFRKYNIVSDLFGKINLLFCISSLANILWIFAWHYNIISLSMLLMSIILICLIIINKHINKESLSSTGKALIRLPFSVYFGWITVATIANATILFVSIHWKGFGIPEQVWTVLILLIGMLIGIITTIKNGDIAYGLVIIWAYIGILIKHVSKDGFAFHYPQVIYTVISCIIILIITLAYVYMRLNKK